MPNKALVRAQTTVYDRPQTIKRAREKWQGKVNDSILNRIKFIGGDILGSIPLAESNDDVYFI